MKNIHKGSEPKSLERHRCKTSANYGNYAEKDELRESLVKEQRGICCYCMQRIRAGSTEMKIEHWQCQELYPESQLDYKNLLAACLGGEGRKRKNEHCDTRKGALSLIYSPASPGDDVESKLKFLLDGIIESEDAQLDKEINEVLNLNEDSLVRNRKAVIEAFRQGLIQTSPSHSDLRRELRKWDGDDDSQNLEPFCQVVIYYLRKKLRRMP